jgi:hypothetical protein
MSLSRRISYSPDCYLIFVDESGNENLSGDQRFFGLGGCGVLGMNYEQAIIQPWRKVREIYFGSPDAPFHTSEIRTPSQEQIKAIEHFFQNEAISRMGVGCSWKTAFEGNASVLDVIADFGDRIAEILKHQPCNSVEVIFESTSRLENAIESAFSGFSILLDGSPMAIELNWMDKSYNELGLEVADFIANSVGCEIRKKTENPNQTAKHFGTCFKSIDPRLVSYRNITGIDKTI